ncbi:hypothetical protein [Pseudoalteromonas rhizosphaerae]|uniref:hypothetical protein n=1 Tax=Pseudoalteromonas rhizosphaerae TaxID=2518973 RepID=UPI003850F02D
MIKPENKPYQSVLAVLSVQLYGCEKSYQQLALLSSQLNNISEPRLISSLLTLDFMLHHYINDEGEVWDIQKESYQMFCNRSESLKIVNSGYSEKDVQYFFQWIVMLSNWEHDLNLPITYSFH